MGKFVFVNGRLVDKEKAAVSVFDSGLLHGFGVFETILVREGRAVFLEEHLVRLEKAAARLDIALPEGKFSFREAIAETIAANKIIDGMVRLTVTAGVQEVRDDEGNPTLIVLARPGIFYPPEIYKKGFKVGLSPYRINPYSPIAGIKSLNYLPFLQARHEGQGEGFDEMILRDTRGSIAEGTISNLFVVMGGSIITPPADTGLLPGIVRQKVLELGEDMGIDIAEADIGLSDLKSVSEAFLTNSLMGIMPVSELLGRGLDIPGVYTGL